MKNLNLAIKLWVDTRGKNIGFQITNEKLAVKKLNTIFKGREKNQKKKHFFQQMHRSLRKKNERNEIEKPKLCELLRR